MWIATLTVGAASVAGGDDGVEVAVEQRPQHPHICTPKATRERVRERASVLSGKEIRMLMLCTAALLLVVVASAAATDVVSGYVAFSHYIYTHTHTYRHMLFV